ncbi:transposase, partial [Bifidobacterium ruminantium]
VRRKLFVPKPSVWSLENFNLFVFNVM